MKILLKWLNKSKKSETIKEDIKINCELFPIDENNYGSKFKDHYFEQYKLYVELADRISQRRNTANTFFLTSNTALLSVMGFVIPFLSSNKSDWNILFSIAGILLSVFWIITIRTHKQLNKGKFMVINKIEERLPLNLFNYEWHCLGQGIDRKKYLQLSRVELSVPILFISLYTVAGVFLLYQKYNLSNTCHYNNLFECML